MSPISNSIITKRNVDMVFCIDSTGSMSPCIENVKNNARQFRDDLVSELTKSGSEIDSMRVKVISFRDYGADGDKAMSQSTFFELPVENSEYVAYLAGISADGGGDAPENGVEALYFAMKSDFSNNPKDRQIIVLFTDADALELGDRRGVDGYPTDMVDEAGLISYWSNSSQDPTVRLKEKCKRLVMFAPKESKYQKLSTTLNNSWFKDVGMNDGLKEIDFADVIKMIAASIV